MKGYHVSRNGLSTEDIGEKHIFFHKPYVLTHVVCHEYACDE